MKSSTHRRAFTLWEMILIMALLGVAGLLTSRLFIASMRSIESAPGVQEQQVKLDRMMTTLRRDVWAADRIDASGKSVLLNEGGKKIQWTFGEASATRSIDGDADTREQWGLPFKLEVQQDGASLILQRPGAASESRRFISQMLMTAEAK